MKLNVFTVYPLYVLYVCLYICMCLTKRFIF